MPPLRFPGIHMHYPFVPMPHRKPLRWPNGKRMALMITTNLEYWDAIKDSDKPYYPGGPGIVGGDLPGNVVALVQASQDVRANLAVLRTADDMIGNLLDLFA